MNVECNFKVMLGIQAGRCHSTRARAESRGVALGCDDCTPFNPALLFKSTMASEIEKLQYEGPQRAFEVYQKTSPR